MDHLEDEAEEEERHEREVAQQAEVIVGAALVWLGDGGEQEHHQAEDEADDELHGAARLDEDAEADEEELLADLDDLPRVQLLLVVLVQEGEGARERARLLGQDGGAHSQQEQQRDQRDAHRVEGDREDREGADGVVLGAVAVKRVVGPQVARAVVEGLAVEGLEGEGGDHREDQEGHVAQARKRVDHARPEQRRAALAEGETCTLPVSRRA